MATLLQLRNNILTSIYGRRLGLNNNEFLAGPKDIVKATQSIGTGTSASSTGTEILNYGITSLAVATAAATTGSSYGTTEVAGTFALAAPEPGVEKVIYTATSHSTMLINVQLSTGVTALASSLGSSFGGFAFNAPGQFLRLIGLSTSRWLLSGMSTGVVAGAT